MGDRFGERGVNKGGYIGVKGGIRTYKGSDKREEGVIKAYRGEGV